MTLWNSKCVGNAEYKALRNMYGIQILKVYDIVKTHLDSSMHASWWTFGKIFTQHKYYLIESDKTTSIYNVSTRVLSKK